MCVRLAPPRGGGHKRASRHAKASRQKGKVRAKQPIKVNDTVRVTADEVPGIRGVVGQVYKVDKDRHHVQLCIQYKEGTAEGQFAEMAEEIGLLRHQLELIGEDMIKVAMRSCCEKS